MSVNAYEKLEIYELALELAVEVYILTKLFPRDEIYGIISQLRRAISSVGVNIAEGCGRYHFKDKLVFFYNSRGSLYETQHFVELAGKLGYLGAQDKDRLMSKIQILSVKLNNFIRGLKDYKQ